jgi:hypothetical protein
VAGGGAARNGSANNMPAADAADTFKSSRLDHLGNRIAASLFFAEL